MTTRYVSFAGNTVAIDYTEDDQRTLLDYLFADMDDSEADKPLSRILVSRADAGRTRLEQDGHCIYSGSDRAALARTLVEKTLYTLVDNDHTGLALHAAAVSTGDFGVLIPGQSGAGKSTLAVWLISHGFSYLTDELVHVPLDSNRIEAFTRPINLKSHGNDLISGEFDIDHTDDRILSTASLSIVPHRLLNPSHTKTNPPISVILFPHITSTATHRLEPLARGQAALKLVESLVNGRNIPHHGINQVSRIVREVPAYILHYSGFETLPDLIADILPWPDGRKRPVFRQHRDAAV